MKLCLTIALLSFSAALPTNAAGPLLVRFVQAIPLPNVEGRIDHMAVDPEGQRLFIAALGNNSVEVVDLRAGKRSHTLGGFHEPQGVAWISDRGQLFVASGGDEMCHVLDGSSFASTALAGKIDDADNVRYDAAAHCVYVGCGNGALRVLNTKDWSVVGEITLPAHPESFQLETHGLRIFVNVPEVRQIEAVDRSKMRVIASWPLTNSQVNFPMALDEERRRVFVGCRKPPTMIVLDSDSGKEVATVPIDGDADDVFLDAKRSRIYISCGAGFLDVIDSASFKLLEKIPTASGARTSLFVPELNRLYLAVPHRGDQQAEVRVYEPHDKTAD
jgi:DNA-binding beta-propeller fold protein YncE